MWRSDKIKQAPDSWGAVFDQAGQHKGKVTAYDNPIYIADAALYLKATQARPQDRQPLRARRQAVPGRGRPAQGAAREHRRVLVGLHQGAGRVRQRRLARRHDLAGDREPARGRQGAGQDGAAEGGLHRVVGHLDDRRRRPRTRTACTCGWTTSSAEGQRRGGRVVRRGAGQPEVVRGDRGRRTTARPSTPTTRTTSTRSRTGRRRARTAVTSAGRSARTTRNGSRRGRRSRASRSSSLRRTGRGCPARLLLLAGPARLARPRLPRLARRPVRGGVLAARPVHRRGGAGLRPAELRDARRECDVYRKIAVRTIAIAAAVTVTDALLAFPIAFYMAKVARAADAQPARGRGAHAAVVELPREGLRLAHDPVGGRDPQLGARPVRPHGPGFGIVATWLVFTYLWLPYMIIPIYAGLERIPDSLLDASGDLGASRRPPSGGSSCRSPSRRSWRARSSRSR